MKTVFFEKYFSTFCFPQPTVASSQPDATSEQNATRLKKIDAMQKAQTTLPPIANTLMPITNELAQLFECPVCFETALPPIFQCPAGHLICNHCRGKVRGTCPQCRTALGNIRNRAMEQVASTVSFPCKYKMNGCLDILDYKMKLVHEENCEFRPYMCPCPGASCRKPCATLGDVMYHLTTAQARNSLKIPW